MQEAKRGDRVSLNTSQRLFYFQDGVGGINLASGGAEVAIIPENASDHQLAQINHAIKSNQLILGWPEKSVEVSDRESDMKVLLEGGRNKIEEWMYTVRDYKKIPQHTKVTKIEKLVSLEKAGKNRKSVLKTAELVLGYIGGISSVEEEEQEKVEIKLTSGNVESPEENKG